MSQSLKMFMLNAFNRMGLMLRKYGPKHSEKAMLQYLLQEHAIDTVIDVGANQGQFALQLRKLGFQGSILSFEPLSTAFAILSQHALKDPKWQVFPYALGNENGKASIQVAANSYSSSLHPMLAAHLEAAPQANIIEEEEIEIRKLADFITEDQQKTLLKIDTQGHEKEVILGAAAKIQNMRLIYTELSFVPLYEGAPLYQDIVQLMDELGFELYQLYPELTHPSNHRLLQANGIFVKHQGN